MTSRSATGADAQHLPPQRGGAGGAGHRRAQCVEGADTCLFALPDLEQEVTDARFNRRRRRRRREVGNYRDSFYFHLRARRRHTQRYAPESSSGTNGSSGTPTSRCASPRSRHLERRRGGNGVVGPSPRNSHSGRQPCFTLNTSRLARGTSSTSRLYFAQSGARLLERRRRLAVVDAVHSQHLLHVGNGDAEGLEERTGGW